MKKAKGTTSFRLSDKARVLLKAIAEDDGSTMTGVLEAAVRQLAKQKGIRYEDLTSENK